MENIGISGGTGNKGKVQVICTSHSPQRSYQGQALSYFYVSPRSLLTAEELGDDTYTLKIILTFSDIMT